MARIRQQNKPEPKRGVLSPIGWTRLMQQAISRAQSTGDKRLDGLRRALQEGKSESFLRRMGVICDADLEREFPSQQT